MESTKDLGKFILAEDRDSGFKKLLLASIGIHLALFILIPLLGNLNWGPKTVPQNYFFDMVDPKQRWKQPVSRPKGITAPAAKEKTQIKTKPIQEKAISTQKEKSPKQEKIVKEEPTPTPTTEETSGKETESAVKDGGGESEGPASSEMTIGNPNFPFSYYGAQIRSAVEMNWREAPQELLGSETQLAVLVKFDILRNGKVANLQILESSWNNLLDKLALRAIEKARIPPLPGEFQSLTITYRLVLRRQS